MDASDVPRFDRRFFESGACISRIGSGALGGKGAGLVRVCQEVLPTYPEDRFPYISVSVPRLTVLATDVFDAFMRDNDLWALALDEHRDDRVAHAFQRADLPAQHVGDLRALISSVRTPLAVRSSSLLEDALDHPFAGVYATKMIPNNEAEVDARFRQLTAAIKFVYASTFFAAAKGYIHSVGRDLRDEKMAVVIQEVVGQRSGDRFYPCLSVVARSYNFYPTGGARPEDGVVNLALGLGKTIVDGGMTWSYCPSWPTAPPPFNDIGDLLKNTQTSFWAVHMGRPLMPDPIRETECMVQCPLADAESDGALKYLVSTYDAGSDRLNPGLGGRGPRALTFAPLLGSRFIAVKDTIHHLMRAAHDLLGTAVELELAVNLERSDALPARVGFLQMRPMMVAGEEVSVGADEMTAPDVVLASDIVLGNGRREGITDIVYARPEAFDAGSTPLMAMELDAINQNLIRDHRPYLLIGFGRWGTSDPWLGIPVAWGQISGARVIVEATMEGVNPDLSQGSHFFHNLLSFQILYISVEHDGIYAIDWAWLDRLPAVTTTRFINHVRARQPLDIRVDGNQRRGVVRRRE
jgi:hypothetical protein